MEVFMIPDFILRELTKAVEIVQELASLWAL